MIRCIALDDEPPALTVLQRYAERVDIPQLDGTFTRPSEAQQYLKDQTVDFCFSTFRCRPFQVSTLLPSTNRFR